MLTFGLVTACVQKEIADPYERLYDVVITATIDDAIEPMQTRTCIDMNTTASGVLGLLWQATDCIGVYSKDGSTKNAKFESKSSSNVAKADFGGSMTEGDDPWRAYYPYSKDNDGVAYNSLKGILPSEQPFNSTSNSLVGDYKYGAPVKGTNKFNFRHLFSLFRVSIDATGTKLANDQLENIIITITDPNGKERPINGSFTFNAENGSWGNVTGANGTIVMPWSDSPVLSSNKTLTGFVTVMPNISAGDIISVTVNTAHYKSSFKATCNTDIEAENVYNIPLKLSNYAANAEKFEYKETARPSMDNFTFNVANNTSKLLDNQLVWNNSDQPQFNSISNYSPTITGSDLSFMIPYLYDFKLKPTFTVSDGCTAIVGGQVVKSGETEIDFTKPVVFTVSSGEESREYTVTVTNTGIPVVVLKHSSNGDFTEKKTEGGFLGIGKKTLNKFVNFWVRGKDTDWVTDDQLTVYNADGSINLPTTNCGAKLRGNTSQEYPKKPFAIKLADKAGAPILDMPAHNRWVLLANWLDHSMIRNTVAFDIAHAIEQAWRENSSIIGAGIPWNVHGQNVELVIFDKDGKGHHVGNYFLCEQIKTHVNRLNIPEPYADNTCGHLLEVDNNYDETSQFKTTNKVPFMFKDEVENAVLSAVQTKVQAIEDKIYSGNYSDAYKDLDINSVIDQWLIWELTMNREYGDPRSVYMFTDANGKLCAGPVWDFDRGTFQNTSLADRDGNDRVKPYNEWICWRTSESDTYIWYKQLIKDPIFQNTVKERWKVIYPSLTNLSTKIEGYRKSLRKSFDIDSKMWPTDDDAIHEHKNPFTDWSGDENINDWDALIDNFIYVYEERLKGMDDLITYGNFTGTPTTSSASTLVGVDSWDEELDLL